MQNISLRQDNLEAPKKDLAFTYLFDETDEGPREIYIFHTKDISHYVLVPNAKFVIPMQTGILVPKHLDIFFLMSGVNFEMQRERGANDTKHKIATYRHTVPSCY